MNLFGCEETNVYWGKLYRSETFIFKLWLIFNNKVNLNEYITAKHLRLSERSKRGLGEARHEELGDTVVLFGHYVPGLLEVAHGAYQDPGHVDVGERHYEEVDFDAGRLLLEKVEINAVEHRYDIEEEHGCEEAVQLPGGPEGAALLSAAG